MCFLIVSLFAWGNHKKSVTRQKELLLSTALQAVAWEEHEHPRCSVTVLLHHCQAPTLACQSQWEGSHVVFWSVYNATYLHIYKRRETTASSKQAISSRKLSPDTQAYFPGRFPRTLFPNAINQLSISQGVLQNKANGTELPQELKPSLQGNIKCMCCHATYTHSFGAVFFIKILHLIKASIALFAELVLDLFTAI